MGKKAETPDFEEMARLQGEANVATARLEAGLNRPDIYKPTGSQVWTQDPNNPDKYILTESLSQTGQKQQDALDRLNIGTLTAAEMYALPAVQRALGGAYGLEGSAQTGWDVDWAPDQRMQTESGIEELPWLQEKLDYSSLGARPEANWEAQQAIADSVYQQGARYLDPQYEMLQNQLDTKLSNQGVMPGSEGASGAQGELGMQRQMAYGDLRDRATQQGLAEMQGLFGMEMTGREQGVNEITGLGTFANQARGQGVQEFLNAMAAKNSAISGQANIASQQQQAWNQGRQAEIAENTAELTQPINVLTGLMSQAQVTQPQFQPFNNTIGIAAPPVYQAAQDQYKASNDAANRSAAMIGNFVQAGASMAKFSDRRLKSEIEHLGDLMSGLPVYRYRIGDRKEVGVMADEVLDLFPDAVIEHPSGYLMVDYAKVH